MQLKVIAKKHSMYQILIWIMGICSDTTKKQKDRSKRESVCGLLAVLPKYKLQLIFNLVFGTEIF